MDLFLINETSNRSTGKVLLIAAAGVAGLLCIYIMKQFSSSFLVPMNNNSSINKILNNNQENLQGLLT
jgi:hypothetical protein